MSLDQEIVALERVQRESDDPIVTAKLNTLRRRRGDARLLICTVCRNRDPIRGEHDDVKDGAAFIDERTCVTLVRKDRSWLSRDMRPAEQQWCPLHNEHLWESVKGYDPRSRNELGPVERDVRDGRGYEASGAL